MHQRCRLGRPERGRCDGGVTQAPLQGHFLDDGRSDGVWQWLVVVLEVPPNIQVRAGVKRQVWGRQDMMAVRVKWRRWQHPSCVRVCLRALSNCACMFEGFVGHRTCCGVRAMRRICLFLVSTSIVMVTYVNQATPNTPAIPPATPARANPQGIAKVPDPKKSKKRLANIVSPWGRALASATACASASPSLNASPLATAKYFFT